MSESRTIRDPFLNKDVQISSRLVDRLRGRYATGPTMPNGEPEFGWREFPTPPIQHEAATEIDRLQAVLERLACRHVTEAPLWWQSEARAALNTTERSDP